MTHQGRDLQQQANAVTEDDVASQLESIHAEITSAAEMADRDAKDVSLVAVSKVQPPAKIEAALKAGHRVFGENRVQEAAEKFPPLRNAYPDLCLHLIGPLQTNKVKEAAGLFDVIETLDRPKLAEKLAVLQAAGTKIPTLYVQVNTGQEPQKAGIPPHDAEAFVADCRTRHNLPIKGLMCIPPVDEDPSPHFAFLKTLADRCDLAVRSMGMSGDFPLAIAQGSTAVRVGSAIFGERPQKAADPVPAASPQTP